MREWFLIYYNKIKQKSTGVVQFVIMRNMNEQELIQKVTTRTENSKNEIKREIDNYKKRINSKDHSLYSAS